MTVTMQSARGASVYTQTDNRTFRVVDVPSFLQNKRDSTDDVNWSAVIDELLGFRTLQDDWDGEGTAAPQPDLVDGAITLAMLLQS